MSTFTSYIINRNLKKYIVSCDCTDITINTYVKDMKYSFEYNGHNHISH